MWASNKIMLPGGSPFPSACLAHRKCAATHAQRVLGHGLDISNRLSGYSDLSQRGKGHVSSNAREMLQTGMSCQEGSM